MQFGPKVRQRDSRSLLEVWVASGPGKTIVPWTDFLANVAAEPPTVEAGRQFGWDDTLVFYRQI